MSSRKFLHGTPGPDRERVRGDDWRNDAACLDADQTLFFISGTADRWTSKGGRWQAKEARAICKPCPVAAECLADALRVGDPRTRDNDGFRAGMTPQQRDRWLRNQRRQTRAEGTA